MNCHGCGMEIETGEKVFRGDSCPSCARDLHVCRNCSFYDPAAHHGCREPQAEWVADKEKANFCDYFRPGATGAGGAREQAAGRSTQARRKLDDLFKDKA